MAAKGGSCRRAEPADKGEAGSKHHAPVEQQSVPLAAAVTTANVHDRRMLEALLDAVVPVRTGRRGRPRRRRVKLHADKGYDHGRCYDDCVRRSVKHRIARRRVEPMGWLSRHCWTVERTLTWLARDCRLAVRYERLVAVHRP